MAGFFRQLLRGRMFGHPIHTMLVHFPSALFPTSLALDFLARVLNNANYTTGAFFCLAAGILGGSAATLFGAIDFFRLPSGHPAWKKAAVHAFLNVCLLLLFVVLFGVRAKSYPNLLPTTTAQLLLSAVGTLGILYSNFLGGELVLRHRVGVIEESAVTLDK